MVELVVEVVLPACTLCLRGVSAELGNLVEDILGLKVIARAVDAIFCLDGLLADKFLGALLAVFVGTIGRKPPFEVVAFGQFLAKVALECDGGLEDVVVVGRGVALAAALHLGAVDRRVGQGHVGRQVVDGVAFDLVLGVGLHAEEPYLGLLPLDAVELVVTIIVIVTPDAFAVVNLVGVGRQDKGIAVSLLEVHVGEVEGGAFLLTEADGHFLRVLECVIVEDIVDVRGHVGLM